MKFILMKKIDGEWYPEGTFSENNIERLCLAYRAASLYAEDVKVEVEDTDRVTCGQCKHAYIRGMQGFCPYRSNSIDPNGYCERGEKRD